MTRSVLVLNHFAVPRGHPGGTRHVELFSRLEGWRYLIVASDLNHLTGEPQKPEPGFQPVRTMAYTTNGWRRVLNWVSYAVTAFWVGVRQRRIDVVYGSSPHLLAALAAWAISAVRRVPFVLEVRDLWPRVLVDMGQLSETSLVYRVLTRLEMFLYARARRIVVMAQGARIDLVRRGVPDERIAYIPNGADPADFVPSAPRGVLREKYGFDKFTAIYTGAHGPANGLDLVLDAAEEVRDLPITIVLVGGGVQKSALRADAEMRGLVNVRFLDPVPKSEIPDLLHAADVGLHILADVELFRDGVSPNKVFDYMAAELPIITNAPGVVGDLIVQTKCGFAVTPSQISLAARAAYSMPREIWARKGVTGRSWIEEHQSRSAMAWRLGELLRDSLAASWKGGSHESTPGPDAPSSRRGSRSADRMDG